MAEGIQFPTRPLTAHPPGFGPGSHIWPILGGLFLLAGFLFLTVMPIPDLVADWSIRNTAQPMPFGEIEDGRCSTRLVLVICSGTLVLQRPGLPEIRQEVSDYFVDLHFGDYTAQVMADPARPEHLTTDLALDKFWNRALTLGISIPLFTAVFVSMIRGGFRRMHEASRIRAALRDKVMRPILMRLDGRNRGQWQVVHGNQAGQGVGNVWSMGRFTKPLYYDPDRKLILGITPDGSLAMPLDSKLKLVNFTREERDAILRALPAK